MCVIDLGPFGSKGGNVFIEVCSVFNSVSQIISYIEKGLSAVVGGSPPSRISNTIMARVGVHSRKGNLKMPLVAAIGNLLRKLLKASEGHVRALESGLRSHWEAAINGIPSSLIRPFRAL